MEGRVGYPELGHVVRNRVWLTPGDHGRGERAEKQGEPSQKSNLFDLGRRQPGVVEELWGENQVEGDHVNRRTDDLIRDRSGVLPDRPLAFVGRPVETRPRLLCPPTRLAESLPPSGRRLTIRSVAQPVTHARSDQPDQAYQKGEHGQGEHGET